MIFPPLAPAPEKKYSTDGIRYHDGHKFDLEGTIDAFCVEEYCKFCNKFAELMERNYVVSCLVQYRQLKTRSSGNFCNHEY